VFTFGPEWCSASFRNAVQLGRNPQFVPITREGVDSGRIPEVVHVAIRIAVAGSIGVKHKHELDRYTMLRGGSFEDIESPRFPILAQFPVGLSARSITRTSTGPLMASSFSPSCFWRTVKTSGSASSAELDAPARGANLMSKSYWPFSSV